MIITLICLLIAAHSAKAQAMSLTECINYALNNSTQIKENEIDRSEVLNQIRQQKRFILPEVNAYANYWQYLGNFPVYYFPETEGSIISGGTSNGRYPVQLGQPTNFMTGIELNQKLFDARFFQTRDIQNKAQVLTDLRTRKERENIVYNVTKTYIEIGKLQLDQTLIRENIKRIEGLEEIVTQLVDNEIAQRGDLEELSINKNRLRISERKLLAGIYQKTEYLKLIMGMEETFDLTVSTDENFRIPEDTASRQSVDLDLIDSNMEFNESRLKIENAKDLPYLDLYVKAQWQQQQDYGDLFSGNADWYNLHIAGLRLNVPILGGNRRQTRKEAMVIENERLELKRDLAQRSQQLQRNKAISDLEIALETIDIMKSEVDLRVAQSERAGRRYQEGVGALREVLDSEADLTRSTLDLNKGILDLEIAKLELLKSQNNLLMLAE